MKQVLTNTLAMLGIVLSMTISSHAADLKSSNATVTAASVANQIKTQAGCSTAGYVWVPASNTCVAQSAGTTFPTSAPLLGTNSSGTPIAVTSIPSTSVTGLGTAAAQNTSAFDASGVAATVKSYFTSLIGYLSCNGSGCTAATTIPSTSISGLGTAATQNTTGAGAAVVTGPTTSVSGHLLSYTGTSGQASDSGIASGAIPTTASAVASLITTQSGCSTAGYVWVPASNTCVAQSSGGTPGGINGQSQYNNSGTLAGQWLGASPNRLVYQAFGDSITAISGYLGPTVYPSTYVDWLRSYLNVVPQDLAYGGDQACDGANKVAKTPIPSAGTYNLYTWMEGTNDAANKGTGAYEAVYNACEIAGISYLATPAPYKVPASSATLAGTWAASTSGYALGSPIYSATNGSTQTYTITSTGNPIIGWYRNTDGDGGTFTVSIDGGAAVAYTTATTPSISTVVNSGTHGISPIVFTGVAAGTHTIVVTVTSATSASNNVEVLGFAPIYSGAPSQNVYVLAAGVPKQNSDANSTTTAEYNSDAQTDISTVAGYGLPVTFVNVRNYIQSGDFINSLHPNASGILHYAQAFQASFPASLPIPTLPPAQVQFSVSDTMSSLGSVGIGVDAAFGLAPGGAYGDTAIGFEALPNYMVNTAVNNTAIGFQSQWTNNQGGYNTSVGYQTLLNLLNGSYNTFMGDLAGGGAINSGIQYNTGVGYEALYTSQAGSNTAFGASSLFRDTTGGNNTAVGYQAASFTTTGQANSAFGQQACNAVTTGSYNTCLGYYTANNVLQTGSYNILIGADTANYVTTPSSSTSNFLNIGNGFFATGINLGSVSSPQGAFGILTTTPGYPLDVNGNTRSTEFLTTPTTVTASATPALVATSGLQTITLNANAAPTITGIASGQRITFEICQPGTGGPYTWTWPAAFHGGMAIGTTASTCSIQSFDSFNGTTLVAENAGISGVAP